MTMKEKPHLFSKEFEYYFTNPNILLSNGNKRNPENYLKINSSNDVEMKYENNSKKNNLEKEEKMNISFENEFQNNKMDDMLYNQNKYLTEQSNYTSCSNSEIDKNNIFDEKMENINRNISIDEIKSNVQNVKEYMNDILENLIEEEEKYYMKLNPFYYNFQYEINPNMRAVLIDWLIDLNRKLNFQEETLINAIYIMDSYLSKKFIKKIYFQLLGVTSLMISSKINEIYLRPLSVYSDMIDNAYLAEEIKIMEKDILNILEFNLLVPSPLKFYEIITQKVGFSNDINKYKFGEFLIQSFLIDNHSLYYSSSIIAIATCYIVMKFSNSSNYKTLFNSNFFGDKTKKFENSEATIIECSKKICETLAQIINSNFKSTIKKYFNNPFVMKL